MVLTFCKSTLFFVITTEYIRPGDKSINCRELGRSNAKMKKRSGGVAGVLTETLNIIKWRTTGAKAREFTAVLLWAGVGIKYGGQALSCFPLVRG